MGFTLKKVGRVATAIGTGGLSEVARPLLSGPTFPTPPGLSPQEQQLMQLQQQFSGLYDANGNLDPAKVAELKAKGTTLQNLQFDRYQRALEGTLPVSVGLQQEQADAFKNFATESARRGAPVTGTTFANAMTGSTAGNQRLMGFQKSFGLRADQERQAALQNPYDPYATSMGFLQPAAATAGGQRELGYNADLTKYAARNARQGAILGLAGQLGATALTRGASAAVPSPAAAAPPPPPSFYPPQTSMGFSRNPYNRLSLY